MTAYRGPLKKPQSYLALLLSVFLPACAGNAPEAPDQRRPPPVRQEQKLTPSDLLRSQRYPILVIDVLYMEGFRPDRNALHNLQQFLRTRLDKPGGIYLFERQIPAISGTGLSASQVRDLVRQHYSLYSQGAQATIGILYTSCYFRQKNILAHSVGNSCIVVYGAAAKEYASVCSIPTQTTIESTLLMHELGHLMGLVDKGAPAMGTHEDRKHRWHCRNPDCLMYWQIANLPRYGPLSRRNIPLPDSSCIADLRRIGGR